MQIETKKFSDWDFIRGDCDRCIAHYSWDIPDSGLQFNQPKRSNDLNEWSLSAILFPFALWPHLHWSIHYNVRTFSVGKSMEKIRRKKNLICNEMWSFRVDSRLQANFVSKSVTRRIQKPISLCKSKAKNSWACRHFANHTNCDTLECETKTLTVSRKLE